jgi:RNA polymerase sigma-70 factor (ECF subfamily)
MRTDIVVIVRKVESGERPTSERRILVFLKKSSLSAELGQFTFGSAMPEPTSTQVLLHRVQTGDNEALNELYNRYLMRVLAAVRARLGAELRGKLESWDVVQDALLASLKNVRTFDQTSEGAFLNWLAKVVENRIRDQLDYFRAQKRDHRLERPLAGARSVESSAPLDIPERGCVPTPSRALILSEDLARLEKAMDQLPEESRELIVAVKIEGRTYQEIAEATGKSPEAVRMQVNRALLALTKAFRVLEGENKAP